jgi:hypothetical protein
MNRQITATIQQSSLDFLGKQAYTTTLTKRRR